MSRKRTYVIQYLMKVHQVCSFLICKRCVIGSIVILLPLVWEVVKFFRFLFQLCGIQLSNLDSSLCINLNNLIAYSGTLRYVGTCLF